MKQPTETDLAAEMFSALKDLVCCSAFNGQVFEKDRESHRAWTIARYVIDRVEKRGAQVASILVK